MGGSIDRLQVKPGMTGLWQVEARDKSSFEAYRRLDLFYVENWSVWLDVAILLKTVGAVVRRVRQATARAEHPSTIPLPATQPVPTALPTIAPMSELVE